jgi:hypothetical protein
MKYFSTLPKILTTDYNGSGLTLTNIMARAELRESLLKNPLLFYSYDIQEGDTPEIVAEKYYGDPYRYWIVLFSGQLLDPQWDWPMSSRVLNKYIVNKYSGAEYANSNVSSVVLSFASGTVKEYRKTITTTDGITGTQTSKTIVIDEGTFNNTVESTTTQTFTGNYAVTQSISLEPVSIYNYESELNESKRTINLINKIYVNQIESQFKSLMGT